MAIHETFYHIASIKKRLNIYTSLFKTENFKTDRVYFYSPLLSLTLKKLKKATEQNLVSVHPAAPHSSPPSNSAQSQPAASTTQNS